MFDILSGKIVIKADILAIPPFKKYWESFNDKSIPEKEITYCVFTHKWDSPYNRSLEPDERYNRIMNDVFNTLDYKFSDQYKEFEQSFIEFLETPTSRLLTAAQQGIDFLIEEYATLRSKQGKTDNMGKPLVTAEQVGKWLIQLGGAVKSYDQLKEQVRTEEKLGIKAKGQSSIGYFERPQSKKKL